jgi:hypothetical protein
MLSASESETRGTAQQTPIPVGEDSRETGYRQQVPGCPDIHIVLWLGL